MKYILLGYLLAQVVFAALIYTPADAQGQTLAQVERSIANSPIEVACSFSASGVFIGCLKGTAFASAPPGTDEQLRCGTITHSQPLPSTPFPDEQDVVTARRNGWGSLRLVQGRYRRAIVFNVASTVPTLTEYQTVFEASLTVHHVWWKRDPIHLYQISGSFSAILASGDATWDTLASKHHFVYLKETVQ